MRAGLYGWFNTNLRGRKGQQGFTLIELLVVVTILGILAAIVTLSLVGLTTNANVNACNQEYKTVQAALDAYMANNNLDTLPNPQLTPTHDMTGLNGGTVPLFNANPSATSPNYTRNGTTQFFYTWDTHAKITNISTDTDPLHVLTGCVVR
ncbi:MAG TPA: type II secretion system protein [Candidatus Dormibacteraeota bacterium]|nr:type II secretion system protein [Candidatus Dormibacteraeota bacterium]